MKSQKSQFHLIDKNKSLHRILLTILCFAKSTYDYIQKLTLLNVYRESFIKKLIFIFLLLPFINLGQEVFPGAKGFGANWTFTSNYEVRVVTNLNNSGTGSLRTAVTTSTTYDGVIVVFNGLSGIINLDSSLVINIGNKHLYIAGQTSENGIFVKNSSSFSSAYLFSLQNDYTIIRGIGIGNNYSGTTDTCHVYDSKNVILDRCTILWGTDETLDIFGNWNAAANPELSDSQKITVQNCIIGEPLNPSHRLNTLVYVTEELSFYQNLFIHSVGRVPLIESDGYKSEIVRNIGYNNQIGQTYFQSYADTAEHSDVYYSAINNYEKTGSDSNGGPSNAIRVMLELGDQTTAPVIHTYSKGNINPSRLLATNDEYDAIRTYGGTSPYTFPEAQKISEATWNTIKSGYPLADEPIITHTELETLLTGSGGVGTFTRNSAETRLVNDVINSTGSFTNTGVVPTIANGTIIDDADDDGIPDSLEGTWGNDTFGYVNNMAGSIPSVINADGVSVSPSTAALNVPENIQLVKEFTPTNTTNQNGVWSSSNTSVATVSNTGLVTSISEGTSTITFTSNDGGFSDTSIITVTNIIIPAESVSVSPDNITLDVNETSQLSANFLPSNTTNIEGIWSSSNTSVVIVDDLGNVTGIAEGTAAITFTADDNNSISDSATVNVVDTFYGSYNFYNADTDEMIQEITENESFDLNVIGDQINFRSIPQGGDNNSNVESVAVEWSGVENGNWTESNPIYAGMNDHDNLNFDPYTVVEGTYNFTVTYYSQNDGNGAVVSSDNFSLTFTRSFAIDAGEDQSICEGSNDTIILTASQADSYLWSNNETTQSITVSPNETTTYTVTGTDSNGNESTDDVTVIVNPRPSVNAGNDVDIYQGESTSLTVVGDGDFVWNNTGETSETIVVSPTETTTYIVTATLNGCTNTDEITVTVLEQDTVTADAGQDVSICINESVTLSANGGTNYTYLWSTGETTQSIEVSPSETFTYSVTVSNGTASDTDEVIVNVLIPDSVTANAGQDVTLCENESTVLTASGGTSYLWSTGETTQSIEVSPTETTVYSVTVSIDNISDTDDVEVSVNPAPIAYAGEDISIFHGEAITLTASGGSEYIWSTGETSRSIEVNPTENTTYTVEVIEAGCSDFDSVNVTVSVAAYAGEDVTICQGNSVTLSAYGGSNYLWNTGETAQTIEVSPSQTTTYSVEVSNGNSSDEANVIVSVNLNPSADAGEDATIEEGQNVTLIAQGGNSYLWSTGETTQNISVNPSETTAYTVEAIINGCSDFDEVIVSVVAPVNANAGQDIETCLGEEVILTATGGEYFEWSTGETAASISVTPSETTVYSVSVSNGISTQTDEVMVVVDNCSEINEESTEFDYRVFPNPTTGQFNVEISGLENISGIYITNILGMTISSETIDVTEGSTINKTYNLSTLPRGIYFVTLVQSGENAITKKIILK